jgi:serpin B
MRALVLALPLLVLGCDKSKTPEPQTSSGTTAPPPTASEHPVMTMTTTTSSAPPVAMPAGAVDLAKGSNELGFDLYRRIGQKPGNLAMSPASISAALAMTYGGAKGETATQMKKVAHFTGDPSATMTVWGQTTRALVSPSKTLKLRVANRLFGEKTYTFVPGFLEQTKTAFDAPLEPLDFKENPDPARKRINGWVEDQTEKRIKDLLPPPSIKKDTRLVLVNAIYFLADWDEAFEKERTVDEPFHLTASTEKKVPTMKKVAHLRTHKIDGGRVVELGYKGLNANRDGMANAMWIVVPDAVDGLGALEKKLNADALKDWSGQLKADEPVALELPRFEVNPADSVDLVAELKALGMADALDKDKADFTGMANPPDPRERLYIGGVFHKAFVKTDEKGTEAAAATAVVMAKGGGAPRPPVVMKVDRPFLFFIMDKANNLVLFMGRVSDPSSR